MKEKNDDEKNVPEKKIIKSNNPLLKVKCPFCYEDNYPES